jgi:hypothetical protein
MVHKIDLDAADRARRAQTSTAIEIDYRGHTYRLPVEQPLETARHFAKIADYTDDDKAAEEGREIGDDGKPVLTLTALDGHYADGLSVLFCSCDQLPWPDDDRPGKPELHDTSCQWVTFLRAKPTRDTRTDLVRLLNEAYRGGDGSTGEPQRRGSSSSNTGARSRRTGNGSTAKTSASKSGAGTKRKAPAKKATSRGGRS